MSLSKTLYPHYFVQYFTGSTQENNMAGVQKLLRAIPEKKTWERKMAGDIFFYGWLVRKVFKLYGSLVSDQI